MKGRLLITTLLLKLGLKLGINGFPHTRSCNPCITCMALKCTLDSKACSTDIITHHELVDHSIFVISKDFPDDKAFRTVSSIYKLTSSLTLFHCVILIAKSMFSMINFMIITICVL